MKGRETRKIGSEIFERQGDKFGGRQRKMSRKCHSGLNYFLLILL
jgi:hypothetical protein